MGKQARLKKARRAWRRRSIREWEVWREFYLQAKNQKRLEDGKPIKKRKFRCREERKRAAIARQFFPKLLLSLVGQANQAVMGWARDRAQVIE